MKSSLKNRRNKFSKINNDDIEYSNENLDDIIKFNDFDATNYCRYVLTENLNIHKKHMTELEKYLRNIPQQFFDKKQQLYLKYKFLLKALELRTNGITKRSMILSGISKIMNIEPIIEFLSEDCSNEEIKFIEDNIAEINAYNSLVKTIYNLDGICKEFMNADSIGKTNLIPKLEEALSKVNRDVRNTKNDHNTSENYFALHDMKDSINDIHRKMTDPSFKLVTGMQGMNTMIGGGFEKRRVYCYFGMSGDGKSTTLENLLVQLWQHNQHVEPSDKTKKPCIVLLTMENFVSETVCSIFNILTNKRLVNCNSPAEVIKEFEERGFEYGKAENKISIVIKYKPANSADTTYLRKIVDELADEGFETIAFLQDYLGRILPESKSYDSYQDLGRVMDDFKVFATEYDIPVITAAQLNRDAIRTIEEGRNSGKIDLIRRLNRSNIGESIKIDQNLDCSFIILKETDDDGNRFMGFKLVKNRYHQGNMNYMYQPFNCNSKGFVQDFDQMAPAFKLTLARDKEEMNRIIKERNEASNQSTGNETLDEVKALCDNLNNINNLEMIQRPSSISEINKNLVTIEENKEEKEFPIPSSNLREKKSVMDFIEEDQKEDYYKTHNMFFVL